MLELLGLSSFILTADLGRSLLTALFGALLGARAAQTLGAKFREREEKLKTVRAANSAVILAYSITESMLNFKHQIMQPTYDKFTAERDRIISHRAMAMQRPPGAFPGRVIIDASAELHTFPPIQNPIAELQELVFKQLSPPIRASMVTGKLSNTLESINILIKERNELFAEFRKATISGEQPVDAYFGLRTETGADERHKHLIENLLSANDDGIYFSKLIGDDLLRYTLALRSTLPETMKPLFVVSSANFSKRNDMMPDPAKYAEYDEMFQEVRAFGCGAWHGKFEYLAVEQYRTFPMLPVL